MKFQKMMIGLSAAMLMSALAGCSQPAAAASAAPAATASASAAAVSELPSDEHAGAAFSADYVYVDKDNVFVYRTSDQILKILQGGSGIVYFGAPWCPWCQQYAPHLNDIAKTNGFTKIYYYNITNDRRDNTEFYQQVISILGDTLDKDDEGNPRVFIPDTVYVLKGKVIGNDNTSSMNSEDKDGSPKDWWTEERIQALSDKISPLIQQLKDSGACNECNADIKTN